MNLNKIFQISYKKVIATGLSCALALGVVAQAPLSVSAKSVSGRVTIAGSTALLPLTNQAKSEFRKKYPRVNIVISGSSSIAGPQSVSKGTATIGACDWDATSAKGGFKAYSNLVAYPVAIIPFAVIVNKSNPVKNLTTKQLQDIYAGRITNWKEVGGKDKAIMVYNRTFGSGTRVNFEEKALQGSTSTGAKGKNYSEQGSSGAMKSSVGSDDGGIGFIDFTYVSGSVKGLSLNGVKPTVSNVMNKKYKVYGTGYLLTKGKATGANKAFIDYIRSSKFQNGSLKKLKFIPLSAL